MKKFLAVLLAGAMLSSVFGFCACKSVPVTVTVFTTNDMHGNLVNDEKSVIGVVQAAKIKASTENALLVDAGACTQGASFASVSRGADVVRMMNEAGYDLMAAGNHEFDYGTDVLLENAALAQFPILAANVRKDGKPLLDSSAVLEVAGYKLGFIGLTTAATATSTNPTLLGGVTFGDEIETTEKEISALKTKTDAIILVCHLGDNGAAVPCTSEQLLNGLPEEERSAVTAVIDGHSHTVEEKTASGIPILQTGVNFAGIGKLTLTFQGKGQKAAAAGEILDYAAAMAYTATEAGEQKAAAVSAKLSAVKEEQDKVLKTKLCEIASPLWGGNIAWNYAESRIVETSYGDFVTDAFKYYAEQFAEKEDLDLPVVAVENGGGISQSLPTSYDGGKTVTRGDVLDAFSHGNMVEVLKVSPAELFATLEKGLATTGQDDTGLLLRERVSGSFLQCSGFSYTYAPAGEAGNKVTEVKLEDGTVLSRDDAENKLLLATNSYVATSFAKGEKLGELGGEDMLIVDRILSLTEDGKKPLDYPCSYGRILIDGDKSPETYEAKLLVTKGDTAQANKAFSLSVDGGAAQTVQTDAEGYLTVSLPKGAHTLSLEGAANYVYVNNYSGTGVAEGTPDAEDFYTKAGYYVFCFLLG